MRDSKTKKLNLEVPKWKVMRGSPEGIPIEQTVLEQRVKVKVPSGEEWWWVPVPFCEENSTPCDLEE